MARQMLRRPRAVRESEFAREVRDGLTRPGQRELPSKYLYDSIGSALFEVITLLPEYGLTRADERLLTRHAEDILSYLPSPLVVAELGSGSGRKTRWILEALSRREPTVYYPIDISASALVKCRQELADVDQARGFSMVGLERPYLEGLREVVARRPPGAGLLVLFLGSTIGNFERPAAERFLAEIRQVLLPGDALLLGTDLVKPVAAMLAAYDDPIGVTAAFNLNLLARINRELGGNISLANFAHQARWNDSAQRIEMHLRSRRAQRFTIVAARLNVAMEADETIWTEASHKFSIEEVGRMAERTGYRSVAQWVDLEWPFAESLWIAMGPRLAARPFFIDNQRR